MTLLGERDGRGLGELRDFQMRLKLSGGEAGAFEASGATVLGKLEFTDIRSWWIRISRNARNLQSWEDLGFR